MLTIQIARWSDFQHYKRRRPPWLRLYHRLLDDPDYRRLEPRARCLLIDLWLLASEEEHGKFSVELPDLAWRLRLQDASALLADLGTLHAVRDVENRHKWLTVNGLDGNASTPLATRKQHATPETETETETEQNTPLPPSPREGAPSTALATRAEPWAVQAERLRHHVNGSTADLIAAGQLVLSYFNAVMQTHYRWSAKTQRFILARLKESRSVAVMFHVTDGAAKDDTIMGRRNDSPAGGYKRISTVFRDAEQIDRFLMLSGAKPGEPHPTLEEFLRTKPKDS